MLFIVCSLNMIEVSECLSYKSSTPWKKNHNWQVNFRCIIYQAENWDFLALQLTRANFTLLLLCFVCTTPSITSIQIQISIRVKLASNGAWYANMNRFFTSVIVLHGHSKNETRIKWLLYRVDHINWDLLWMKLGKKILFTLFENQS